ncbi:MAG: heavy metal translocating P-type ATPase [Desulfobacterales bacterium]|nr:heavy metal translocating P-type ATPase [Desulfobacterales bacterium]
MDASIDPSSLNHLLHPARRETSGRCDLCGLPLRYGIVEQNRPEKSYRFCCTGCRQVFQMLVQSAEVDRTEDFRETELFKKCREMGLIPRNEADLAGVWRQGGAPDEQITPAPDENTLRLHLTITGMWCPVCAWAIEETLKKTKGVKNPVCMFSADRFCCDYNPVETGPETIIDVISRLGYQARLPEDSVQKKETRAEFIRLGVSAFLTMNLMMLSFALYFGFFHSFSAGEIDYLSWPVFVMATIVFVYGGAPIFRHAVQSIRTGIFGMEMLIFAGALSAYGYSLFNFLSGSLHLYFDTAAMLISLTLVGKWLERSARNRIAERLSALFSLQPAKARICLPATPDGRYVSAKMLKPGDTFRVEAEEVVAADGIITEGRGFVDESTLTGEARPKEKRAGDVLLSGTRVTDGDLRAVATRVGTEGTLGQMVSLIERTLMQKTRFEDLAERLLRWFVPLIIGLAAATGCFCWYAGLSADAALIRAVTVLVVSCPCALGVAVPLARVAGISAAGANGILVRSFSAFEKAKSIHTVVLDKTGTVTEGQWTLKEIVSHPLLEESFLLGLAAGLEEKSNHPIGVAIRRAAAQRGITPLPVDNLTAFENGMSGGYAGKMYFIGSIAFLRAQGQADALSAFPVPGANTSSTAASSVYLGCEGGGTAVFVFRDSIRESAFSLVKALKQSGLEVALISGDDETATAAVANQLGITDYWGERLPADKVAFIQSRQNRNHCVAMVGDGINDAPALARADFSVAVHSGNQLSEENADITLMGGDLQRMVYFFDLAKQVRRKIAQNLLFTSMYNMIAIPVAMAGWLSPLVAVSAMLISSLSVIGNTLLLVHAAARLIPKERD